ncbi:MAG: patatin-like phospholipase family protein [Bacteroidota bacterium]|nr:patatin-like phospholipase family protein [Bacteroidota bacterium]
MSMIFSKHNYTLGVALSGGGAKGFAHIGALKALNENGHFPEIISGTSAGSIIGALYCDGYTPDEIVDIFSDKSFTSLAEFTLARGGFMTFKGLKNFLEKYLKARTFEELEIPLVVCATDFDHAESIFFRSGPLIDVICASSSIPIIFQPVKIHNINYVDGGVLCNLPVRPIREECKTLFGINVTAYLTEDYKNSFFGILERSFLMMLKANTIPDKELCDLYIETAEGKFNNIFNLEYLNELVQLGYHSTLSELLKRQQ